MTIQPNTISFVEELSNVKTNFKPPVVHPVVFDSVDAALIRSTSLHISGAAGPSGLDAYAWRRLCTFFKTASFSLCHSLALATKRLCTEFVDPECISPLLACRLIALDKNPGVSIGETVRQGCPRSNQSRHSGCCRFRPTLCGPILWGRVGRPHRP